MRSDENTHTVIVMLIRIFVGIIALLPVVDCQQEIETVEVGSSVTFSCPDVANVYNVQFATNGPPERLFNYSPYDSNFQSSSGRFFFDTDRLRVTLSNVGVSDEGVYTCSVTDGDTAETVDKDTQLQVYSEFTPISLTQPKFIPICSTTRLCG